MKHKMFVDVYLSKDQMTLVDMWRQGVKVRTGKLPMRSVAIAQMISEAGRNVEVKELRSYVELLATLDGHGKRLDMLEAAKARVT